MQLFGLTVLAASITGWVISYQTFEATSKSGHSVSVSKTNWPISGFLLTSIGKPYVSTTAVHMHHVIIHRRPNKCVNTTRTEILATNNGTNVPIAHGWVDLYDKLTKRELTDGLIGRRGRRILSIKRLAYGRRRGHILLPKGWRLERCHLLSGRVYRWQRHDSYDIACSSSVNESLMDEAVRISNVYKWAGTACAAATCAIWPLYICFRLSWRWVVQ